MTTARETILDSARILEWTHSTSGGHDILVRGERMIDLEYTVGGTLTRAWRYRFFRIDDLHLIDQIWPSDALKKEKVLAWLAE